jgi:predicted phosphodiesterase
VKRTAIVSDIHSNIEALEAVLDDIHENECEEIVCLGDLLGYGPSPRQVLKIAMDLFEFTLLGNHEEGILYQPVGFNWKAEASAWWTKDQLKSPHYPAHENRKYWTYLEQMPRFATHGDVLYVHASPIDPTREYVMPEACYNPEFMTAIFKKIKRVAFGGHTHLPGIFFENRPFLQHSRAPDSRRSTGSARSGRLAPADPVVVLSTQPPAAGRHVASSATLPRSRSESAARSL